MRLEAVVVVVEGRVQGVGYRNFSQRRAQNLGLTGYAVNLRGGQVKIRAEGSHESIEGYVRVLKTGPPLAQVERVTVTPVPYTGQYRDFSIRFSEGG